MTNKTKQKRRSQKTKTKAKKTPFADVGEIVGQTVAKLTGFGGAKGIGRWLGSGIGSIFGSGDYQMVGMPPEYNVLANGKQIPKFESNDRTNIVCHREFIGDIYGSAAFQNNQFPINPSDWKTFPWLASVAKNYQQYRIHGLIFEFRPLITDFVTGGRPGVVVMATNYNSQQPAFKNKVEMENSEFAVSVKPTLPLIHAVECSTQETSITRLYVDKTITTDPRFTDMGLFQLATQGQPTADILGELWVSYCVEFYKPQLTEDVGGAMTAHVRRTGFTDANPFGLIGVSVSGDVPVTVTTSTVSWAAPAGTLWEVVVNWIGTTPGVLGAFIPSVAYGNGLCTFTTAEGSNASLAPEPGVSSLRKIYRTYVVANTSNSNPNLTFQVTGATGLPTGTTSVDVLITQLDSGAQP